MKKVCLILCLVMGVFLTGRGLAAQDADGVEITRILEENALVVSVQMGAAAANAPVGISVASAGAELRDETAPLYIMGAKQLRLDEAGKGSQRFVIWDEAGTGWYDVIIGCGMLNKTITRRVFLPTAHAAEQALKKLNAAGAEELTEVIQALADQAAPILEIDIASYLTHCTEINAGLVLAREESPEKQFTSLSQFMAVFQGVNALVFVNAAQTEAEMEQAVSLGNTAFGLDLEGDFQQVKAPVCKALLQSKKDRGPYQLIGDFTADFWGILPVALINESGPAKILEVIKRYNDILELDLTGEYTKHDAIDVMKGLEGQNFASKTEVQAAFQKRLDELAKQAEPKPTQRPPGGGTHTSGGKNTQPIVIAPGEAEKPVRDLTGDMNREESGNIYMDTDGHWAQEAIAALTRKGILAGGEDRKFRPDDPIKKEELIKIIVIAFDKLDNTASAEFADVPAGAWYYKYVASAAAAHIVYGDDCGMFGTGEAVSREDLCAMLYRVIPPASLQQDSLNEPPDIAKVAPYAREAVLALYRAGVVRGMDTGNFEGKQRCTRAQVAVMIHQMLEGVEDE